MKKILCLLLGGFVLVFTSCFKDSGSGTFTYFKATPVYEDLSQAWDGDLVTEARSIVDPGKIYIGDDFILIGEEGKGIHIVNNDDIDNPIPTAFISIPGNKEFFVNENIVYAESLSDFVKIDISNMDNIQLVHRNINLIAEPLLNDKGETLVDFTFEKVTEKLDLDGELYNALNGGNNFVYFDYLNEIIPSSALPSSFAGSGGSSGAVNRIAVKDEYIYLIDKFGMTVIEDQGNSLVKIDEGNIRGQGDLETVFADGDLLFFGTSQSVEVFNISNPSQPFQVNAFTHATSCDPVLPKGDVAYVTLRTGMFEDERPCAGTVNQLVTLEIRDESSIVPSSFINMESPYGLTVANTTLYVGEGANGLKIFDVENRYEPSLIKSIENIEAFDIIAHPNRPELILVTGPNGLQQFEVSETLGLELKSTILF